MAKTERKRAEVSLPQTKSPPAARTVKAANASPMGALSRATTPLLRKCASELPYPFLSRERDVLIPRVVSVLIWPHEGVGAVSVTHGDCLRLKDEEFLNDTLIELGLKSAPPFLNQTARVRLTVEVRAAQARL